MIGRVVGNYEIVERIGEGGMGTVWRAVDVMLEREVAIKAIRPDLAAEPQIVERFRAEAKILARVHHPAIATIYSFFREGGDLYLAMEFVRGRSLARVLQDEGALSWPRAVSLTAAALEGIEQVHRTGIVHRDLKPDNLMLTESGDIKVMDFGIARAVGENRLTRTGFMVGTIRYMAPEQLRGEEVDSRADLYSLGIVLYEMLTGRVPFTGGSEYEAIRAQVEDPPVPPSRLVPSLPVWLDQVVLTALAKQPEERYPSAAAMAESLASARFQPETAELPTVARPAAALFSPRPQAVADPTGSSYRPVGSSYRPLGLGRSRTLLLGIAGALLFFGVAAGVAWYLRGRSAPAPGSTEPAATATTPAPAPAVPSAPAPRPSPTPAVVPSETKPAALPTVNPAIPEPKPPVRRSPPPSAAPQEVAATEPPAPSPAAPPSEEPAASSAEAPAVADDLPHLGDQLDAAAGRLADAESDFRSEKKDRGETLTETDDKLRDEIDNLRAATTRFNRRVNASFFRRTTWRLRREGEERQRAELAERVREIDDTTQRIEGLVTQLRPGEAFLAVWREVRGIRKRIDTLSGR